MYSCASDGGCSSVGRAPGCGPGGRGFKPHQPPHFSLKPLLRNGFFLLRRSPPYGSPPPGRLRPSPRLRCLAGCARGRFSRFPVWSHGLPGIFLRVPGSKNVFFPGSSPVFTSGGGGLHSPPGRSAGMVMRPAMVPGHFAMASGRRLRVLGYTGRTRHMPRGRKSRGCAPGGTRCVNILSTICVGCACSWLSHTMCFCATIPTNTSTMSIQHL